MTYPRAAFLILPYTRLELPGWGRLFELARAGGVHNYGLWKDAPSRVIRDKLSGYRVRLELADWSERHAYFLGRHYDLALQLLMEEVLAPGDRFVDVGANIGAMTLRAAALVGPAGRVDAFEPNPECCARIAEALALNGIEHVRVHPLALSDRAETLKLSVITEHTGMATLAAPDAAQAALVSRVLEVPVREGDEVLAQSPQSVKLVKVDVEGFELRALRGLRVTLAVSRPVVVTEVQRDWLARAGASRSELARFMAKLGYAPFGLDTRRHRLRHRLALAPLAQDAIELAPYNDFVWLRPEHHLYSMSAAGAR